MSRQILLTIIIIILVICIIPLLLTFYIEEIPSGSQPSLDYTEKIYQTNVVTKEFRALDDRLSSIGVSIKNPNLANKQDLSFKLLDSNNQILRTVVRSGWTIEDGNFVIFSFDPITNSLNKQYKFVFESSESDLNNAFEVFIDANSKEVSYVSFYHRANIFSVAIGIISGWFLKLYSDFYFFLFYIILISGALIYLTTFKKYAKS